MNAVLSCNEGLRYMDLIRWKDAEKNTIVTG